MKKYLPPLMLLSFAVLTACSNGSSPTPPYTLTDIGQHKTAEDCWMAIDGKVYDFSKFIALGIHNPKIVDGCGSDATELFNSIEKHSGDQAQKKLQESLIGSL